MAWGGGCPTPGPPWNPLDRSASGALHGWLRARRGPQSVAAAPPPRMGPVLPEGCLPRFCAPRSQGCTCRGGGALAQGTPGGGCLWAAGTSCSSQAGPPAARVGTQRDRDGRGSAQAPALLSSAPRAACHRSTGHWAASSHAEQSGLGVVSIEHLPREGTGVRGGGTSAARAARPAPKSQQGKVTAHEGQKTFCRHLFYFK